MCYCLPLSLCSYYCSSLTNKLTPSLWPLHPRHTLLEPVPTEPQMWSSGDPNCSEQASHTEKTYGHLSFSLSATPLSEWNPEPSCLTSEVAGWQGWSGLWLTFGGWFSARSLSILTPDELLKGSSTVYKVPHSVMDQKVFHTHQILLASQGLPGKTY